MISKKKKSINMDKLTYTIRNETAMNVYLMFLILQLVHPRVFF